MEILSDVVNYLLSKDKFFENSYDLYQDILYHLQPCSKICILLNAVTSHQVMHYWTFP